MIHRLLALDLVGFEKLDLAFEDGLVVFTGPSGAGKSVLIGSILSLIGLQKPSAKLSEMTFDLPAGLECGDFELDEEVVLKLVNKEKARYYINDQSISKARLKQLFSSHFKHLSVRSGDELSRLQQLLDLQAAADDKGFEQKLQEFENRYMQYKEDEKKLLAINEDENKVQELIEFARFEIDKIESIDPKPGEDEELMQIKHKLSKIDKIKDSIEQASRIFEYESAVFEAYSIMDKDSSLFDEAMNQLRNDFESSQDMVEELSDVDVEYVLDRIEKLSELKNRFGTIQESLNYLDQKKQQLREYENISFTKTNLQQSLHEQEQTLHEMAAELTKARQKAAKKVQKELNGYLKALRLTPVHFVFSQKPLSADGIDRIDLDLKGSTLKTLSGGEYNRVRLALLVVKSNLSSQRGVIILDEIDANVSGDESIAIADMVQKLSHKYQIFAISHQPHISAAARQHYLVTKDSRGKARVQPLSGSDRVEEIARIIGGENPGSEAVSFAKKVLAQH